MKFTVVTPSFNQGRFIDHTIDSVLSQAGVEVQYLVMDGGSRDQTVEVLRRYGKQLEWVSEKDNGQTHAINKGLLLATGEIVAYLNSDDVYMPGALAWVAEAFRQHPEVDVVYGDFLAIDEHGTTIDHIKTIPFDANVLLYDANFICQPASFYRRSLLDKIGRFDESLRFLMDYEFFLRAAKRGVGFHMVPEPLACIRFHSECKTLSDGVHPWGEERRRIISEYARPKAHHPSALRMLRWLYRAKRYLKLMARGRVDFANLRLARRLRQMV